MGQLPKSQTIKGLERGLQVLQFLQSNPISSLHQVHTGTKISKPSLLRILHTLERSGLVSRRLGDGRYRVSANLTRMARRRAGYDRIAEAAAPVLDRLCQQISYAVFCLKKKTHSRHQHQTRKSRATAEKERRTRQS